MANEENPPVTFVPERGVAVVENLKVPMELYRRVECLSHCWSKTVSETVIALLRMWVKEEKHKRKKAKLHEEANVNG